MSESMKITLIIPTYNEKENLPILIKLIFYVFEENLLEGNVILVDDNSPDGTGRIADELSLKNNRIKVIHRKGKEGLSSAVMEGFRYATGEIIGVMDADLSHPPDLIPKLVFPILSGESEFTLASRYLNKEEIKRWPFRRKMTSRGATILAKPLTNISDPMSGFFFFKKNILDGVMLSPIGYKIMLEILVKAKHQNIKEIPYVFKDRYKGQSKLYWKEYINYMRHIANLYMYILNNKFIKLKK